MSNTIKIRRGSGVPTASDFAAYELAYDYTGNDLYVKVGTSMVKINSEGSGTVTNVVAGNGLSGGGTVTATLDLDFSELTDMTSDISGTTEFILQDGTTESRKAASEIKLTAFDATGFTIAGTVDTSGTPSANEYARFTDANTIEGRSYSAVRNDLGLNIGSDVQAYDTLLQDIADLSLSNPAQDGYVIAYNDTTAALELVEQSGGISFNGSTANGLLTYGNSSTADVETALLFSGSTLEINNTGDWSYILNNTNSGGLRLGTKDSGGTLAYQIELSNTGNYVKLNENTTITGSLTTTSTFNSNSNIYLADDMTMYVGTDTTNGLRLFHLSSNNNNYVRSNGGALSVETIAAQPIYFNTSNIGRMTIEDDGDIRLKTPDDKRVYFGVNNSLSIRASSAGYTLLDNADGNFYIRNTVSNQNIYFGINDGGTTVYPMTVHGSSSNIGIGTTSPSYKLDITHTGLGLRLNSSGDQQLRFERTGANAFSIEHDASRMYLYNRTTSAATVAVTNAGNFGVGTVSPLEEVDIVGSLKVRGDSSAATEVLELGQFASPNGTTPQYTFNTYDSAGGLPSAGDHLEIRSVRWGQYISFSRNGQGGAVPTALFYNGSSNGYMELYKATNPTTDATYTTQVKLNVNGDSYLNGGNLGIGVTSPAFSWGTKGIEIQGSGINPAIRLDRSDSIFEIAARGSDILLYNVGTAKSLRFGVGGGEKFRINSDGNTYVYQTLILNANNQSLLQRDTGGTVRNLVKIDSGNSVLLGDSNLSGQVHMYPATYAQINTDSGYLQIGPQNTSHCHYTTDRANHWFNQMIYVNGGVVSSYNSNLSLRRNGATSDSISIEDNTVKVNTDSANERFRFGSTNRSFVNQVFGPINNNSKAYIRANNGYSTATTPDYTWWYNDQCGIYHPAGNTIGFSASGEKVKISTYGLYSADDVYIAHGGSDYSPGLQFMGGSNTPGANEYENAKLAYYDNSGTGFMRYYINRSAGAHEWYIGGTRMFSFDNSGNLALRNDGSTQGASIQRVGGIQFTWDRDTYGTSNDHSMRTDSDNLIISSYDDVTINLDSNNNDAAETFDVRRHSTSLTGGELLFQVHGDYVYPAKQLRMIDGSASAPAMSFATDTDLGFYRNGANNMRFSAGNAIRGTWNGDGLVLNGGSLGVNVAVSTAADGRIDAGNDIVAYSSDKRLKENIRPINNALDKVNKLSGFIYNWNKLANEQAGFDMEEDLVGVYAQDVEEVLPEAVKLAPFDNDGEDNSKSGENYLTVQYEKMVPLLIEAIKEQQQQINELKEKLNG